MAGCRLSRGGVSSVPGGKSRHRRASFSLLRRASDRPGPKGHDRSFSPDKFKAPYEEEIKQRATWYYCAQALSEYKIPFLDIAKRQKVLSLMAPPTDLGSGFASALFSGVQPSSVPFSEQGNSFDETVANHERLLDNAEALLARLASSGIRGQLRDFSEIVDVNRAALELFKTLRGGILRRLERFNSLRSGMPQSYVFWNTTGT